MKNEWKLDLKSWMNLGLIPENEELLRDTKGGIGMKRGSYYRGKSMTASSASIISTLYGVGKDITLSPKEMVNKQTLIAGAIHNGMIGIETVPKRGQESCGHDEYDGELAYKFYEIELDHDGLLVGLPTSYQWRAVSTDVEVVRFSSQEEVDEAKRLHLANIASQFPADSDELPNKQWDCKTLNDKVAWIFKNMNEEQQLEMFRRAWEWCYDYKGECAWKDDKSKRCTHHDGLLTERALVVYVPEDSTAPYGFHHYSHAYKRTGYGRYSSRRLDEESGLVCLRIDELTDEQLQRLTSDEITIQCIKDNIPKMKTESRNWIQSTHEVYDADTKTWNKAGKRGYYQLSFWHQIESTRAKTLETIENQGLDGTVINGWKFVTNRSHGGFTNGEWQPVEPLHSYFISRKVDYHGEVKYEEGCLQFKTSVDAYDTIALLDSVNCVDAIMWKGNPSEPLRVGRTALDITLNRSEDPRRFTPERALEMIWSGSEPDDYQCAVMEIRKSPPREVKA